jgi:hypothetical protein
MSLSLQTLKNLTDAELTELYEKEKKLWTEMAKQAFAYTKGFVEQSGEKVREDDVLPLLVPQLLVCEPLRDYLSDKKLRQKYWYTWFAELIIDRLWTELSEVKAVVKKGA